MTEREMLSAQDGPIGGATVTGALHVAVPPGPITVMVNVFDAVTETGETEPAASTLAGIGPTELSIEALVAYVVVQVRVVLPPPTPKEFGVAVSTQAGG